MNRLSLKAVFLFYSLKGPAVFKILIKKWLKYPGAVFPVLGQRYPTRVSSLCQNI